MFEGSNKSNDKWKQAMTFRIIRAVTETGCSNPLSSQTTVVSLADLWGASSLESLLLNSYRTKLATFLPNCFGPVLDAAQV